MTGKVPKFVISHRPVFRIPVIGKITIQAEYFAGLCSYLNHLYTIVDISHIRRIQFKGVRIQENKPIYKSTYTGNVIYTAIAVSLLAIGMITTACRSESKDRSAVEHASIESQETVSFIRPDAEDRPEVVRNWISMLLELDRSPVWHTMVQDDMMYIYIGWGEKPTGGYNVEVSEVNKRSGELIVTATFRAPTPGQMVIQMITHPFDLIAIEKKDAQVRIEPEGEDAPRLLLTIKGVEDVKSIVAGSRSIKLFEPEAGKSIGPDLRVSGIASVFEGTVNYRIRNRKGEIVHESFTTASDGMNWGYFTFQPDFQFEADGDNEIELELFNIDARDGSEINNFRIPLFLDGDR